MPDLLDRARNAAQERVELPGMSLMEHLEELRARLLRSVLYLGVGMVIAWFFRVRLINFIQRPLLDIHLSMTMTHPTDAINLFIKTALVFGAIFASPFILYQVWLFISPGMYANEKKYVFPFLFITVILFLAGAWFGYRYVLPGAMKILIEDYTGFFLAVILGLGICFEMPVVIFFLALFGIVDAKFLLKNFRYAVLAIFIVAGIICPSPEISAMCLFAAPMLVLYFLGVGVAYFVHPNRRKKRAELKGTA